MKRKYFLILIFLILNILPLYAYIKFQKVGEGDFEYLLQTTSGFQSFYKHSEDRRFYGDNQILEFSGMMLHTFYRKELISKAKLNLGFKNHPNFLWSEKPNLNYEDTENPNNLSCIEFDYHHYLFSYDYYGFFPLIGYSFVNYSGDKNYRLESFFHSSFTVGIQYFTNFYRYFNFNSYIFYSPMFYMNGMDFGKPYHYINYEAELTINTKKFSCLLFFIYRTSAKREKHNSVYAFNSREIGFSFQFSLF